MKKNKFLLAAFLCPYLLSNAWASSVYNLEETFGSEKIVIEFKAAFVNSNGTVLGVTEIDKIFINGVAASNNGNATGFTEQYSATNSGNAQINLSNPAASDFFISEVGTSLHISQSYSLPFYHDVIQTETAPSSLFLSTSISGYAVNNGPYTPLAEPSSIALLLMGFSSLLGGRRGLHLF